MKYNFNKKTNKGITLIALVLTIIVLLILAGVSIAMLTGENGILKQANVAKEETKKATALEKVQLEIAGSYGTSGKLNIDELNTNLANVEGVKGELTNTKFPVNVSVDGYDMTIYESGEIISTTIDSIKNTPVAGNTKARDEYGNKIVVPDGFKIVVDNTTNNARHVTEGIVIEDGEGNQFVWIPVGNIKTSANDTTGTEIKLSRYEFADGTSNYTDKDGNTITAPAKGTPIDKGSTSIISGSETYTEDTIEGANTHARNIEAFKSSSNNNGGYYLARYEASYGADEKPNSKVSTGTPASDVEPSTRIEGMLWNWITQPDAATACRNMYNSNNYTSDLVNSYAWDTAIVFIQTFSGDTDYSKQNSLNSGIIANTGINGDNPLNINDMANNVGELTTETCISSDNSISTHRGGNFNFSGYYTSFRSGFGMTATRNYVAFRPILYL